MSTSQEVENNLKYYTTSLFSPMYHSNINHVMTHETSLPPYFCQLITNTFQLVIFQKKQKFNNQVAQDN